LAPKSLIAFHLGCGAMRGCCCLLNIVDALKQGSGLLVLGISLAPQFLVFLT